jgi:magnesium-protoporphyrin IX monomethyl ester (oxidative) cyclase
LDTDNPKFRAGLTRLFEISKANDAAKEKGGVLSYVKRAVCGVQAVWTFGRLYMMDTLEHELPANVRMAPSW